MKVLCVDDDPTILALFVELVRLAGLDAIASSEPMWALQHIDDPKLVAVVSDFMLPHMNGVDFLTHVMKRHPGLKRILVTAAPMEHPVREALRMGVAHRVIAKPPSLTDFIDALKD